MEGFDKEVCRRLPLAEAALRMLDYVCREEFLEAVFARHHGRSYEDVLTFATLVRLVSDALLEYEGSARQAFERARESGELETGSRAPYGKLSRVPLCLSLGLLAEGVLRLTELFAQENDHFLLRWNQKLHFHRDTTQAIVTGFDASGRMYKEDWGWIGQPSDPRRRYVRRIRLKRGAREEEIVLLTDLSAPCGLQLAWRLSGWGGRIRGSREGIRRFG
jgi:hypothetical protein